MMSSIEKMNDYYHQSQLVKLTHIQQRVYINVLSNYLLESLSFTLIKWFCSDILHI